LNVSYNLWRRRSGGGKKRTKEKKEGGNFGRGGGKGVLENCWVRVPSRIGHGEKRGRKRKRGKGGKREKVA